MIFKDQTEIYNKTKTQTVSITTTMKLQREKIEKQLIQRGQKCEITGKTFLYCKQVSDFFPTFKIKTLEYWRMQTRELGVQVGPIYHDTKNAEKLYEVKIILGIKKKKRRGVVWYYFDDVYNFYLQCQCGKN